MQDGSVPPARWVGNFVGRRITEACGSAQSNPPESRRKLSPGKLENGRSLPIRSIARCADPSGVVGGNSLKGVDLQALQGVFPGLQTSRKPELLSKSGRHASNLLLFHTQSENAINATFG